MCALFTYGAGADRADITRSCTGTALTFSRGQPTRVALQPELQQHA